MTDGQRRRLVLIRIVHSQAELGSMREQIRQALITRKGEPGWLSHVERIEMFWQGLSKLILDLDVDWHRVVLYQDSLPVGRTAMSVVADLAVQGSLNHKLLMALSERGARVEGTESIELLIREVDALKTERLSPEESAELIAQRDNFIGHRVDETLGSDEIGFLFLGFLHNVTPYLPGDVDLIEDVTQIERADRAV